MAAGETVGERERSVVLVPIDFEDASRRALDLAKELAPSLGAEVVLLHAYQVLVQVVPICRPPRFRRCRESTWRWRKPPDGR